MELNPKILQDNFPLFDQYLQDSLICLHLEDICIGWLAFEALEGKGTIIRKSLS